MIVHDCEQNSPEWHLLRAGIPTASSFDKIVTPSGARSGQQEKYKFRLLAERILGHAIEERYTWSMERGSTLEKSAVSYYENIRDLDTVAVGFITDDAEHYGASPDRFVGDSGLLECKCPELETHMMYLMSEGSAYKDYKVQCQGQLWVTGREWVDLLSYFPGMPWALQRIERDEKLIEAITNYVPKFCVELEELCELAKQRDWLKAASHRNPKADKPRGQNIVDVMRDTMGRLNSAKTLAF